MDKDRQAAYDYLKKIALDGIKGFNVPEPKKIKGEKRASNAFLKKVCERGLQEILKMEMAEKQAEKKQVLRRAKITEVKKRGKPNKQ